jgi:hypothetical protein
MNDGFDEAINDLCKGGLTQECQHCQFANIDWTTYSWRGQLARVELVVECRAKPPIVIDDTHIGVFPKVNAQGWCGMYEEVIDHENRKRILDNIISLSQISLSQVKVDSNDG